LAPSTRLSWQFSVSFQVYVKYSSSYHIVPVHKSLKTQLTKLTTHGTSQITYAIWSSAVPSWGHHP